MAGPPPPTALADPVGDALYHALFTAMDTAIFVMRGPECLSCNPAGARLFGVERLEDMAGKTPLDFAPPMQPNGMSSVEMVQDNFRQAMANGTHAFEWVTTRIDGQPMTLEVRFTALPDTDQLYLCSAVDVSARRLAEQSLRESEGRFRTIFETAAEGILLAERQTERFRFANPAMCALLGYGRDELLALRVPDIHPPDVLPEVRTRFARRKAGDVREAETSCRRKDGSLVPVCIRSVPLVLDGRVHLIGFFTDLTGPRQLEAERLRTQKLEAVGRLAGGIAHDFNNLLQSLFGFVSLARLACDDRARSLAMLARAEASQQQAVHLTNQLLTFSKGGQPLKTLLELGPILSAACNLALSGSRVCSELELAPDLHRVEADSGQLTQVIHNIVLNAAQAMPDGGTIRVKAANREAPAPGLPRDLPPGLTVAVSIVDTGVGIPPHHLAKIFDPYFTTKDGGTGLGLATCYAIIQKHGGVIDVESKVAEGSTFTVYLPAVDSTPDPHQATVAAESRSLRAARILVMDDDDDVREVTAKLLESLGHFVDAVENGEAAIEHYCSAMMAGSPYDLVIVDLTVRSGLGGVETGRRLKAIDPLVRLVVSSGYSDDFAAQDLTSRGFRGFLKKPYDVVELAAQLAPILAER